MMKLVVVALLVGAASAARLNNFPFKDVFNTLQQNSLKTGNQWMERSLFQKRQYDSFDYERYRLCMEIYECANPNIEEPEGSPEEGFVFSSEMFESICNFTSNFRTCFYGNDFWQTCRRNVRELEEFQIYSYICTDEGKTAVSDFLPCLNQKNVQQSTFALFEGLNLDNSVDFDQCRLYTYLKGEVERIITKNCEPPARIAARNILNNVDFASMIFHVTEECNPAEESTTPAIDNFNEIF